MNPQVRYIECGRIEISIVAFHGTNTLATLQNLVNASLRFQSRSECTLKENGQSVL